jgi:hypothetical protein
MYIFLVISRGLGLHQLRPLGCIPYLKAKLSQLITQFIGTFPIAGCPSLVALPY